MRSSSAFPTSRSLSIGFTERFIFGDIYNRPRALRSITQLLAEYEPRAPATNAKRDAL